MIDPTVEQLMGEPRDALIAAEVERAERSCATCRHWAGRHGVRVTRADVGICLLFSFDKKAASQSSNLQAVSDDGDLCTVVTVGTHGCNEWEPIES